MRKLILGTVAFLGMMAGSANAATVGFTLDIGGDVNVPTFNLTNTSTAASAITNISFTIGDTSRHFDFVEFVSGTTTDATATVTSPDTGNNGLRSDIFNIAFSGNSFDSGENFFFQADLDLDPSVNSLQNYKTVFGNNGSLLNAVATVSFLVNNQVLELTDSFDDIIASSYQMSATQSLSAVPVPAALPLLVTGLAGLGLVSARRKKQQS